MDRLAAAIAATDAKARTRRLISRLPVGDQWVRSRALRARDGISYPDWPSLLGADFPVWQSVLDATSTAENVLIGTSVGGAPGAASVESLLAVALALRGVRPHALLCDKTLPACHHCEVALYPRQGHFVRHGPSADLCDHCFDPAELMYRKLGIPVKTYSNFLEDSDRQIAKEAANSADLSKIEEYQYEGLGLGEHALAGALRFYARATLAEEPYGRAVLRRYVEASVLAALALRALVRRHRYVAAVFNHGIYVPQGVLAEVCRQEEVPVVTWNPAYRKKCFIFSHEDTYHHTLLSEPTSNWDSMPWSVERDGEIAGYLASRTQGTQDWIWFHDRPVGDRTAILYETGLEESKPTIGLLTNVMWDAQLHYAANAFPNMLSWVLMTIDYFASRPDLQLVIRVHPAEIRGAVKTRQPLVEEIRRERGELPANIFLVGPESPLSTYTLMEECNAVLVYGTKTGVELTSRGIRVIVAGEAWIRNKGLTLDASSEEDYRALLEQLPLQGKMSDDQMRRARMYAFHFFFRRMIPIEQAIPVDGNPPYRLSMEGLDELRPGASLGLDTICNGILGGTEFIYPAETLPVGPTSVSQ